MKVLYILSNGGLDGSFLTWAAFVRESVKHNISPYVVCKKELASTDCFQSLCLETGLQYYTIAVYESIKHFPPGVFVQKVHWVVKLFRALWPKLQFLKKLFRYAKKIQPDIIHTNVGTVHEGLWVAKLLHIPHVWHLREYQDVGCGYWIYPTKSIFKRLLRLSHVITLTNDMKRYYGLSGYKNAHIIPDGVYYKADACKMVEKEKYFLCASRIHFQKHIDEAIKAFSVISQFHPDYRLILAGDGSSDYINEMKDLVMACGLDDKVVFLGFCSRERIRQLMQHAKALLVPSSYEGFGLMTAEAAFNGTIVVGREEGGTKEILQETGGVLYKGDWLDLANAMEELLQLSDADYNQMANKAQSVAKDLFSIEKTSSQIIHLYHCLIE